MKIDLDSGVEIKLHGWTQSRTYEGLLEGLPTVDSNQQRIARYLSIAQEIYQHPPVLVPPVEELIPYDKPYQFGIPSMLPGVACAGRFHAYDRNRDWESACSRLVIVWFQADFGLPDESVLRFIRQLDWNKHAEFYEL